jgi:CheY-like chemotaxis protein
MPTKILAVDDAKAMRLFVQRALSGHACDITESTNGYNALFAMERGLPDLILLDVNMPVMGGVELLEMLKSKPELTAIPVIMLASPADHAVLPKIRALGVAAILMKPIAEATLLAAVASVVKLRPLTAAQPPRA